MSEVAALFKKKKKKGKKKKAKSFNEKLKAAGGQLPSQATQRSKEDMEAAKNAKVDTDLLAALTKAKNINLNTDIKKEAVPDQAKLEEMNLREYRRHQEKIKTRESFHKTRKKVLKKENNPEEVKAPVQPAVPVKKSWRERAQEKANASSGANIGKQLQSEMAFPTLGGAKVKKVSGGAWGTTAEDVESDEEIDPEEERRKAEEAEKQRLLEEELKKVWKADPIDEDMATSDKFGRKVNSALNEFLQIEDYAEVILCFQELRNHTLHEKVAVKIIEKGMDNQPEKNQTLLADVLVHMKKKEPYMLTKDQIEGAFKTMEGLLDDLVVDFPKAKDVFALMKKRCQVKGALEGAKAKFIPSGTFAGAKTGYDFKMGANGMGYYLQGSKFHGGNSDSNDNNKKKNPPAPASSKPNPFGSARPVATGTKPKKSSIFGDAKPIDIDAKLALKKTTVNVDDASPSVVKEVKKKSNPFGAAKPVDIKVRDTSSSNGAETTTTTTTTRPAIVKKKSNPFGDAKPVDIKVVEKTESPKETTPAVVKKKIDPFGGAKPVDTAAKTTDNNNNDDDEPNPFATMKKKKKKKKKKAYVPDLS